MQLALGTVQLGLPYGIANKSGMPSEAEAQQILTEAVELGIDWFDTARAYGESEQRLGKYLPAHVTISTKLPPELADAAAVEAAVETSCQHLQRSLLDVVMLHRIAHYDQPALWDRLLKLQQQERIARLGVSVATPEEMHRALDEPVFSVIQMPYNLLDWRWQKEGVLDRLRQDELECHIQLRSIYLQGLLVSDAADFPDWCEQAEAISAALDDAVEQLHLPSRAALSMAAVSQLDWADSLVIGVETAQQLQQNVKQWHELQDNPCVVPPLDVTVPERLLNPALWKE